MCPHSHTCPGNNHQIPPRILPFAIEICHMALPNQLPWLPALCVIACSFTSFVQFFLVLHSNPYGPYDVLYIFFLYLYHDSKITFHLLSTCFTLMISLGTHRYNCPLGLVGHHSWWPQKRIQTCTLFTPKTNSKSPPRNKALLRDY